MTFFEFANFVVHFFLRILDGLTDFASCLICVMDRRVFMRLLHFCCRVFGIAESFLGGAFGLIHNALVRQILIANGFTHTLLHFAYGLINLASYLFLIHKNFSFICFKSVLPSLAY